MASITKTVDKSGNPVYKVQVSNGRGRKIKRSWRPEPGWSARTTKRELNKFAATLENELASGEIATRKESQEQKRLEEIERAKMRTLQQYGNGVFMPMKELSFSENARSNYCMTLNKHIYPTLGSFLMEEITPAMITALLTDIQRNGAKQATLAKVYLILNGIFKMAYIDSSIPANPMWKVERPKPRKDEAVKEETEKAYTVQELQTIFQCLESEPLKWRCLVYLLFDTGIRRGEACGLQWSDIDFAKSCITIRHNLQYSPAKGVYMATTKNGKVRTVDIGRDTLELLRAQRIEQSTRAISKFVFTQENSAEPMHPQSPTRYFEKFGERYGIKDFHPHKLRHSSASVAITNGADVVSVSQRLGHSDTAVTLRMYAHANEESIRRAGEIAREAVWKSIAAT